MGHRSDLQTLLKGILETDNVYFQPPETVKMVYPCIVYQRDRRNTIHADNKPYKHTKRYQVTVIDPNPDSQIPDRVGALPLCAYDRFFTTNNLNHDVFNLYF